MAKKRNPRVDRAVQEAVADLVSGSEDPRLSFVTITEADVTQDHEVATIYYSTLDPSLLSRDPRSTGGDRVATSDEVADALASAAPRLRAMVGRRARLRTSPELRFTPDPVVAQSRRVEELLRNLETDGETADGDAADGTPDDGEDR